MAKFKETTSQLEKLRETGSPLSKESKDLDRLLSVCSPGRHRYERFMKNKEFKETKLRELDASPKRWND